MRRQWAAGNMGHASLNQLFPLIAFHLCACRPLQSCMTSRQPGCLMRQPSWLPETRAVQSWRCSQPASQVGDRLSCVVSLPPEDRVQVAGTQTGGMLKQSHSALPAAGAPAQLLAQAVCASMQLHCMAGRPQQALQHLQQQLVLLRGARVLMRDMEVLWETAVAAAAAARDWQQLQQALHSARAWAAEADDDDSAAFLARLHGLEAAGRLAAEQIQHAVRQYSRAIHLCPTDAAMRVGLTGAVLMQPAAVASSAEVALRLLDSPAVVAAAVAGNGAASVAPAGKVRARTCRMWLAAQRCMPALHAWPLAACRMYDPFCVTIAALLLLPLCAGAAHCCPGGKHCRCVGSGTVQPRAVGPAPICSGP